MFARLGWLAFAALLVAGFWTGFGWMLGLPGLPRLFGAVFVLTFVVMLFMMGAKMGKGEG